MESRKRKDKVSIEFDFEYDEVKWENKWIPKTVYKYRDWENSDHKKILENISVWVPDSYDFNDPFDCNIPIAYDLLLNNEILAETFIRRLIGNNTSRIEGTVEDEVKSRLADMKYKNPDFIEKYKNEILHSNKKVSGILSVTPINDNILMWSHYANSHKGFCVGFNSIELFNYLGGGGEVNYEQHFPIISPVDERDKQYLLQNMTKSIHWAYEIEYRLTTFKQTNIEIEIPPNAISEIIFGANMKNEHKVQIREILKSKLPHVKCFNSIPEKDNFKLKIFPE